MTGAYGVATSGTEGMVGVMERQPPMSVPDKELAWKLYQLHGVVLTAWEHAHHGQFPYHERTGLADLLDEVGRQLRQSPAAVIDQPRPDTNRGRHHHD